MSSSRERILNKLREASKPFTDVAPITERRVVQPVADPSPAALRTLFAQQARKLSAEVHEPQSAEAAIEKILEIIADDQEVSAWNFASIPLPGLGTALLARGVAVAEPSDGMVRVGITGVDAAFASTGSIVLIASEDQPRSVSLLPYVHVAVIRSAQILPHMEAWAAASRRGDLEDFRAHSNIAIISGPSRTADIGMELVLGAHGPAEMHLILID